MVLSSLYPFNSWYPGNYEIKTQRKTPSARWTRVLLQEGPALRLTSLFCVCDPVHCWYPILSCVAIRTNRKISHLHLIVIPTSRKSRMRTCYPSGELLLLHSHPHDASTLEGKTVSEGWSSSCPGRAVTNYHKLSGLHFRKSEAQNGSWEAKIRVSEGRANSFWKP